MKVIQLALLIKILTANKFITMPNGLHILLPNALWRICGKWIELRRREQLWHKSKERAYHISTSKTVMGTTKNDKTTLHHFMWKFYAIGIGMSHKEHKFEEKFNGTLLDFFGQSSFNIWPGLFALTYLYWHIWILDSIYCYSGQLARTYSLDIH